jgi:sugar phosphate isomerase/epimerase
MGAKAVQIDARNELKPSELSETGRRQFLHWLREIGLTVASLHFPTRRTFFEPDQLDARVAAVKRTMEFAFQLKARVVTVRVGRIPEDEDSPSFQLLLDVLNDLVRHGNHIGCVLALTPCNDTPERLAQTVSHVVEGALGINFDPAVFVMSSQDPVAAFRSLHKSVTHIQVRDAIRDVDGGGTEVPVGRGEVVWDELLSMIDDSGFPGWTTVARTTGDDKHDDTARAVQFIKQVGMES